MQCRWKITHKGKVWITNSECGNEATKTVKNLSGVETHYCDRHAKLEMTRSEKYKLGFTIRDISQKDL